MPAWARRACLTPDAAAAFCAQAVLNPVSAPWGIQASHHHPPEIGKLCWMLADGTDTVARLIATELDVRFEQPVRLVSRTRAGMVVETDTATLRCDEVVIAVPVTPTLRIGFDPALPDWKIAALLGTPMSQGGKVIGQYTDGAHVVDEIGHGVVSDAPIGFVWTRPPGPDDTAVVLGLAADHGDGFLRDEERALAALDDLVGAVAGPEPQRIAGVLQDWTSEEFTGGVVSMLSTGLMELTARLGHPIGSLHFAGEHTGEVWAAGMEGAMRSGLRVADEVLQRRRAAH
jgi:monoamine oxidase